MGIEVVRIAMRRDCAIVKAVRVASDVLLGGTIAGKGNPVHG